MRGWYLVLFLILVGGPGLSAGAILTAVPALAQSQSGNYADNSPQSFANDVMPIFKGRCISCHQPGGEGYEKSGLDLTSYAGLMKGTKYGRVVIPGQPFVSNLMVLLDWRASPEIRMPHGAKQLSICDRDAISSWIRQGAKDN